MDPLSQFLARHAAHPFRHRQRLLDGLLDGTVGLVHSPTPHVAPACSELLALTTRQLASLTPGKRPHDDSVRQDLEALAAALTSHAGHSAALWAFHLPPGFSFTVWECAKDGALLGCVLGVESGMTDVDTFERFFGP